MSDEDTKYLSIDNYYKEEGTVTYEKVCMKMESGQKSKILFRFSQRNLQKDLGGGLRTQITT